MLKFDLIRIVRIAIRVCTVEEKSRLSMESTRRNNTMKIEEEFTYAVLSCENCKRTFCGEQALMEADTHAEANDHVVTGSVRHMVTFAKYRHTN